MTKLFYVFLIFMAFGFAPGIGVNAFQIASPRDQVQLLGLPAVGKWLIDSKGNTAHWLGYTLNHHQIDEPINVLVEVIAKDAKEAEQKFLNAVTKAGFPLRRGHSSGYKAYIDGQLAPQFPDDKGCAFSDEYFVVPNDHGRAFGPVLWNGNYYFSAALSREKVSPLKKIRDRLEPMHTYGSFNQARDKFVLELRLKAGAKLVGMIPMDNAVVDASQTTGDHDGYAAYVQLN